MDIYNAFFTLKSGTSDITFSENLASFMDRLKAEGKIEKWRLMRRKLGLGPSEIGEFHLMIEVENLAQLDAAFLNVSARSGSIEEQHFSVNQHIADVKFALYRDFPDSHRKVGEERF